MTLRAFPRLAWVALVLAACAPLPPTGPAPERPARQTIAAFTMEARFAVKAGAEGQSGRIAWSHRPDGDNVLFLSPLGQGMATLACDASGAVLELPDQSLHHAATLDELAERLLGRRLPLGKLPGWMLGLAGPRASQKQDDLGRPLEIMDEGWKVEYLAFESSDKAALPSSLRISQGDVELKLLMDGWSLKP